MLRKFCAGRNFAKRIVLVMDKPVVASYRNELDCLMPVWAASFRDEVAVLGVDKAANPSAKKPITISCNFVFENRANAPFDATLRSVAKTAQANGCMGA